MANLEKSMRGGRVDANHGEIREHLRKIGWSVFDTSAVGRGFPDLVVARRGFSALVEVKNGSKKKLNAGQQQFSMGWDGVCIKATSPADAELQLDLAEKYQYLRRTIHHLENDEPIKIKPKPVPAGQKILRMLAGE